MNFGSALNALKEGKIVRRAGWNGKNMFVLLTRGGMPKDYGNHLPDWAPRFKEQAPAEGEPFYGIESFHHYLLNGVQFQLFEIQEPGTDVFMPSLSLKAADGSFVPGWLASQTDMLAEDWEIAFEGAKTF